MDSCALHVGDFNFLRELFYSLNVHLFFIILNVFYTVILKYTSPTVNKALFEVIRERFEAKGYKLPKLVFWNVNSRTGTIPLTENEMGVILLSGFSKNLMQLVMSSELNPYKALVEQLNVPRYAVIDKVFG